MRFWICVSLKPNLACPDWKNREQDRQDLCSHGASSLVGDKRQVETNEGGDLRQRMAGLIGGILI